VDAPVRLLRGSRATPIGEAVLVFDEPGRLRALEFADHADRLARFLRLGYGAAARTDAAAAPPGIADALDAYFAGDLAAIDDIPCAPVGTSFQRAVWDALRDIPTGQSSTYAQLAARIGRPTAQRAVGAANGANPIAVVIPCHRLVGADGSLIRYGGGLHRKAWLLRHEGARPD